MSSTVPLAITNAFTLVHSSWQPVLLEGLQAISAATPDYLAGLATASFLPTDDRLFATFSQPLSEIRYVLIGEGPYPRPQSATGYCFMDGGVEMLWSPNGLSKQVNRATSLRNFMKMLLVSSGEIPIEHLGSETLAEVSARARAIGSPYVQTMADLQDNFLKRGFLLLNATLVFRPDVAPIKDAKAWQPLVRIVLEALKAHADKAGQSAPTLVLWGKIAEQLKGLTITERFPQAIAEHPYNLSFIRNPDMHALFGPMDLLMR